MKYIFAAAMVCLLYSCHRNIVLKTVTMYQQTYTDKDGNPELLGTHIKEDLQQDSYKSWFDKNFADYRIDSVTASQLKPLLRDKQIEIFMGTWCDDSKREVPRMYKILEYAGVQPAQVKLIMVDNHDSTYKQSPGHEQIGKGIHRVPDLIVYNGKDEMSRIIESPVVSLERDLLAITSQNSYQPNYKGADYLVKLTREKNIPAIKKDSAMVIEKLKGLLQQSTELNTLGYVWMMSGETSEALLAYEFNAVVFPGKAQVYESLGRINMKLHNNKAAKKYYQQALAIEPSNANATKMLLQLN